MISNAQKLALQVGRIYISKSGWLARKIVYERGHDALYEAYYLDTRTGTARPDRRALCSWQAIANWAGREATPEEAQMIAAAGKPEELIDLVDKALRMCTLISREGRYEFYDHLQDLMEAQKEPTP